MKKLFLFFALILGLAVNTLKAQSYNFELLSMDDGLPSNLVYTVLSDKKGYLWIATDKGVAKYNGQQMKVFTTANGLVSNDVWNLKEDSKGRIWLFSFADKMQYIQDDKVITAWQKESTKYVDRFAETKEAIYVANENTLFKFKDRGVEKIKNSKNFGFSFVLSDNAFLYPILDSMYKILDSTNTTIRTYPFADVPPIYLGTNKFMVDSSFVFFLKNDKKYPAVIRWNWLENTSTSFDLMNIMAQDDIDWFIRPLGDDIQIFSSAGYLILDKDLNEIERFLMPGFKKYKYGDFVLKGIDGAKYSIIKGKGVYILLEQKANCLHYDLPQNQSISFLGQNNNKHLLVGCKDGVVYELIDNQLLTRMRWANLQTLNVGYIVKVHELFCEKLDDKELWTQSFSELKLSNQINKGQVGAIKDIDANEQLGWVSYATALSGFVVYPDGDFDLLELGRQYATVISDDSLTWYGGPSGLIATKGKAIMRKGAEHPEYGKGIKKLVLDKNQNVWAGTDGFGVYAYQKNSAPFIVKGCEYDIVSDMVLAPSGNVWVATNKGIKEIEINYGDKLSARVVKIYTPLDGLSSKISSKILVTDSLLFAASPKGIDVLPIYGRSNHARPRLYLGDVIVNGTSLDTGQLDLTAEQNTLTIEYDGVSLASKEALTYHYFIEHLSQDTILIHENVVHLYNLPHGNYVFNIYATDAFGGTSAHERFSFTIAKPWYLRWWSGLLYLGCVVGVLYAVIRYKGQKTKKKMEIEARMSQLKLQALQSQLNPHFIFNALGAIQQYMFEHSPKEAEPYFSGFSHLLRLYLESSKKPTLLLKDELELIKTYISLEKLRFQDKFSDFIDIDKNLEVEYIKVPTMVLQPFVENAINHGLFHKVGKGKLCISLEKIDDDFIRVVIQDDGIGREKAKKITQKRIKTHQSRSMQIIEERIKIMKSIKPSDLSITILDLYDEKRNPSGTRVEIVLPVFD